MKQQSLCIWFTGMSGSGKTTIAKELKNLMQNNVVVIIDGDDLRSGANFDLKYTNEDRTENVFRAAQFAKILLNNNIITIVTLCSPTHKQRRMAKDIIGWDRFILVYIDTPLEICEKRDPKGLYGLAKAGKIKNMIGVDLTFEIPIPPAVEIEVQTADKSPEECAEYIYNKIRNQI